MVSYYLRVIFLKFIKCLFIIPLFFLCSFRQLESSYIIMEASSKRVLKSENRNKELLIASTTKIMTAIVCIENFDLNEEILILDNYTKAIGSSAYLKASDILTREELLYALMLRSGNDAALALSNNDSFDFIYLMNNLAKKIGMNDSYFVNSSGLDEENYNISTAYDMALLMSYASQNETFLKIAGAKSYKIADRYTFINKHKLILSNDAIAGKTGYTTRSGRVLVTTFSKYNTKFVVVSINAIDDWNLHKKLMNETTKYQYKRILKKGYYDNYEIKYDIYLPISRNENNIVLEFVDLNKRKYLQIYADKRIIVKNLII